MSHFEQNTPVASAVPTTSSNSTTAKPQRVLACVLCQQRKVKCDRTFPCANCVKSDKQCVPNAALTPRQRRRRFPERELLDRLRYYESLLQQNNIDYESLQTHIAAAEKRSRYPNSIGGDAHPDNERRLAPGGSEGPSSPSTTGTSETVYKAKNLLHALNQTYRDSDDDCSDSSSGEVRATAIRKAVAVYRSNDRSDHLLFGSRGKDVDLSALHPEQVQIFKLWQIYLDNISPLLKVTHTPSLQGRIIDAASNVIGIKPTFAALMFSIYCVSIMSLDEDQCQAMFGSSKQYLLVRYQSGCQQALLENEFLRSNDRESLTALYLYLVSARSFTDPQSLSTLLSLAIRIAQRMGLHSESANVKCNAFEAEMRRRLWWSLVLFDTRICELAENKSSVTLIPTWDCHPPLNVNDFDLQLEMKEPPAIHGKSSEALFALVRSEIGSYVRHSASHLDFTVPSLKAVARDVRPSGDGELNTLEKVIEDEYLLFCNPGNPLHFMTIWVARGQLARIRLVESFSRSSDQKLRRTNTPHDVAISYAHEMLECDTKLTASPFTKGYLWFLQLYFPFPAYILIVQELRRRPGASHAEKSWQIISSNYEARIMPLDNTDNPFLRIFAKNILQAWEAREKMSGETGATPLAPLIVSDIRRKLGLSTEDVGKVSVNQPNDIPGTSIEDFPMTLPVDFGDYGMFYGMGGQAYESLMSGPALSALDIEAEQLDWSMVDWNTMPGHEG